MNLNKMHLNKAGSTCCRSGRTACKRESVCKDHVPGDVPPQEQVVKAVTFRPIYVETVYVERPWKLQPVPQLGTGFFTLCKVWGNYFYSGTGGGLFISDRGAEI
jgi:hypothetical protein